MIGRDFVKVEPLPRYSMARLIVTGVVCFCFGLYIGVYW